MPRLRTLLRLRLPGTAGRVAARLLGASVLGALLAGCAWVELRPEGRDVRVADTDAVVRCELKGRTTVKTAHRVLFFPRRSLRVEEELRILARNEAANLDGDTVAPLTEIEDGRRVYGVYRCR